ncbi:MAG: transcription elongation factor GreA [Gemmataceae bacterium]
MSDNDRIPMTRAGYEKLKAELEHMENVLMPEVTRRVAAARALGDLSENAEYHAAREDQGLLKAKIDLLRDKLSRAYIVDPTRQAGNRVAFGCCVRVLDLDLDQEEVFHIVGPGEEDYDNNRILSTSPLAQGLLGKEVGQIAEIEVPAGLLRFRILEVTWPA